MTPFFEGNVFCNLKLILYGLLILKHISQSLLKHLSIVYLINLVHKDPAENEFNSILLGRVTKRKVFLSDFAQTTRVRG